MKKPTYAELEAQLKDALEQIDEYNILRKNKEAFAKKCFMAGSRFGVTVTERDWLNFKVRSNIG